MSSSSRGEAEAEDAEAPLLGGGGVEGRVGKATEDGGLGVEGRDGESSFGGGRGAPLAPDFFLEDAPSSSSDAGSKENEGSGVGSLGREADESGALLILVSTDSAARGFRRLCPRGGKVDAVLVPVVSEAAETVRLDGGVGSVTVGKAGCGFENDGDRDRERALARSTSSWLLF